ncbi:MAG: EamA family transporter [Mogibacterium sp.]|nr:EamA family transporter [Mogibacterium sp.]
MHYLLLAICSSSLIAVVMRISETKVRNNISELAVNYALCLALGIMYTLNGSGIPGASLHAVTGSNTIVLGLISGAFYVGSFLLYQYNIRRNGVVLPATFMKLGVLIPVILAIIAFGEKPGAMQIAGIILALSAIVILNNTSGEGDVVTSPRALLLLVLIGGSGDAMSKIYEELGDPAFKSHYLMFTFVSALALCALAALMRGQKLSREDILYGCLIGIPNYYSARFLLLSLSYIPAATAYPTFSVGTILLVSAAGVLIFREKMDKRQWLAVILIITALILLNV